MAKRSEGARKGLQALIEKGRARRRMKRPHVPREGQKGWVPKTPAEIARQAARQKSKAKKVTDLPKAEQAKIKKALEKLALDKKPASGKAKPKRAAPPLTKRNQRLLETQARLQKPVRKARKPVAKTTTPPVVKGVKSTKSKVSKYAAVPAGVAGAAYYLGRDKPGKWQDYKSIRAAKSAGSLYYSKDGKKMAAVYRGDLKPGQSLREYMNEKTGKTRRTDKAGGGEISTARRAGAAKKGFGPTKKYMGGGHPMAKAKKMQGGGLSRAQQNMLRQAQEYAATSGQNPAALRALTAQHGDLYGQRQQSRAQRQMAGSQPGRTSVRSIGPGMKKGGLAKLLKTLEKRGMGKKAGGAVKKKSGGAAKKMQRGGSIPAHERMASGEPIQWQQGPVGERRRRDYLNYVTPGVAKRQLAKQAASGGPGRRAVRGAGGAKAGGAVKKQRGGELTHMASGDPIQWQQGPVGQRRKRDYMSYMAPGVAKRQMSRQAAAGGPGRGAIGGAGPGGKKGGVVKATRKSKPRGVGVAKRGFGRALR